MSRGQLGKHWAEMESQDTAARARAAGTPGATSLGTPLSLTLPLISTDTSSSPAPQLSEPKLSWLWHYLCLLSLCLITILKGEETDDHTT